MEEDRTIKKVGIICNAWINGVLDGEEAMDEIYKTIIEGAWEKFKEERPEKAKEIEDIREEIEEEIAGW